MLSSSTETPDRGFVAPLDTRPGSHSDPVSRVAWKRAEKVEGTSRQLGQERRRIEQDLRAALTNDGLVLHYQPRLALGSGQIIGAEALLRWPHRRRGMVSPAVFIPVAERSDLISDIGGMVLRRACAEAALWPTQPNASPASISVNVSARQLIGGLLLHQLADALEFSGLSADRLELELTESMLVDSDTDTLLVLSAIRDRGVGLALDDFGTGYASLSMLKRLPLTVMKLDRSPVRGLPIDREDAAITRAVVETGHALGLTVVAEGIETEAQRAFLSGIGCDEGQGFLFSPAVPPPSFRDLLCKRPDRA